MEKLLEIAKKNCNKVEVYSLDLTINIIIFENAKFKNIESKVQSGISLRIIKDGRLGFSYTNNLINREEVLQNALDSLKGGIEATFDFPLTKGLTELKTYDPSMENLSNTTVVEECTRVCKTLTPKTKGQINIIAASIMSKIRLINDSGTDISFKTSNYLFDTTILYHGSYASIHRSLVHKRFKEAPNEYLDFILHIYNQSLKEVNPKGGKIKVLFMPETMYVLIWRIQSATSGASIYQNQSPITEKIGKKLFDEKITLYDDALNDRMPGARAFDDEGTPCQYFPIIENGVLKNFYYDLHHAKKMNSKSTGHGFKSTRLSGAAISSKPSPTLKHLYIKPGNKSFADLIKSIDKGFIAAGALGAHSGNILNGDFSIGLCPGLYIENGEIVGHVKDIMVAGNIYNTFKNVIDIEDTNHLANAGTFPAILFDNVSMATKN